MVSGLAQFKNFQSRKVRTRQILAQWSKGVNYRNERNRSLYFSQRVNECDYSLSLDDSSELKNNLGTANVMIPEVNAKVFQNIKLGS